MKFVAAHLWLLLSASPVFADCLKYEPSKVTLTGIIHKRIDPGPPGYGENPKTDSKEEHLYLHLDHAVCVEADLSGENEAVAKTKMMEMVYFVKQPFQHGWLNQHVSVTGTLFHAITGHHWTPALITPSETHILKGVR